MGLLPRQGSAFREGAQKVLVVFVKSFWEETEKQKSRSCRAQEFPRSRAQWKGWNGEKVRMSGDALLGNTKQSTRGTRNPDELTETRRGRFGGIAAVVVWPRGARQLRAATSASAIASAEPP